MSDPNLIFALDIGTRTVVGLILKENNGQFEVVDLLVKEHQERSMLDGQIHDVISVSKVINTVKEELEKKHGTLSKVCVAAAGRALKTERASATVDIVKKPMIDDSDILFLELNAVQQAQIHLANEEKVTKSTHYYCVGYSVLHYFLDGEEIGNLVDQQGEEAKVEVIATFLPKVVVESLISALERANLQMAALTLEPIAAINVLIPPSMRRLNVALVDIGAGTSDIAITDMGTVVAYGMVPTAGDEITEAISDQFLLDFPLAEQAKKELYSKDEITIKDILGFETTIQRDDVIQQISSSLENLAGQIALEIKSLNNNKSPKAVMLVGGGSLTPELPKLLSQKLQLPENRIAIRGIDAIQQLKIADHIPKSPELVTPIGIAISASLNPVHYITVYVNDRPIRLFDMKQLTVADALLTSAIEIHKLYGKPGMAYFVTVNGREITLPGGHGQPPFLQKNGGTSRLDDVIENNDRIFIEKGNDGQPPHVKIADILDQQSEMKIDVNEKAYSLPVKVKINGRRSPIDTIICDSDKIETYMPTTIEEALEEIGLNQSFSPFYIFYNKRKLPLPKFDHVLLKNGVPAKKTGTINDGDHITFNSLRKPTLGELFAEIGEKLYEEITISFNDESFSLKKKRLDVFCNDSNQALDEDSPIEAGESVYSQQKNEEPFIFQDIFRFVDIEFPNFNKGNFILLKNDEQTTFQEQVFSGDKLQILWPK
jgi:cell division protein FtsA